MKRKALGKGLSSLIPSTPPPTAPKTKPAQERKPGDREMFLEIDVDRIRPNPRQPRAAFEKGSLEKLSRSLKENGFMQPIVVRALPRGRFEIVAGERRWRAAQLAGILKVPAVIQDVPDEKLLEFALVENLMREDLNPIEEARAYRTLADEFGLTQQEIAGRVGKQRATVTNMLRLLALSKKVQDRLGQGKLSMGHARALASLSSSRQQEEIAALIEAKDLSVRQVESMVARLTSEKGPVRIKGPAKRDPNVEAAEEKLQSRLGTRVRIVQGKKGGRVEIHYFGDEELQRIYDMIFEAAGE